MKRLIAGLVLLSLLSVPAIAGDGLVVDFTWGLAQVRSELWDEEVEFTVSAFCPASGQYEEEKIHLKLSDTYSSVEVPTLLIGQSWFGSVYIAQQTVAGYTIKAPPAVKWNHSGQTSVSVHVTPVDVD